MRKITGSHPLTIDQSPEIMRITKLSSAAILAGVIVKIGADANHVVAGVAGTSSPAPPIGVTLTAATGAEQPVTIATLDGVVTMTASAAIAAGVNVETEANGKVSTLGAGVGVHLVVGVAITAAAADNDPVLVATTSFIREI